MLCNDPKHEVGDINSRKVHFLLLRIPYKDVIMQFEILRTVNALIFPVTNHILYVMTSSLLMKAELSVLNNLERRKYCHHLSRN